MSPPETSETTGADLWHRVVELVYERRAQQLWDYGRRVGLDVGSAEEVMQEVFVRLLRLPALRRPDNPDAWLFRSVHNAAVDQHRRTARVIIRDISSRAPEADDAGRLALWAEVDRLPLRQRQSIYLRYRADLDYPTIAAVLGISESGARANLFRAMAELRERMSEQ